MEYKEPILLEDLGMQYVTESGKHKHRCGMFKCGYCGNIFRTRINSVKEKSTSSCGCQIGLGHKHGLESHRLYPVWYAMKQRCTNPKYKSYSNYGGRGITICEEWLDVKNFIEWSKSSGWREGLSVDRIDNDKGYSPENCRWVDRTTQNINQRIKKTNTSGFVGVNCEIRSCKWVARVSMNNNRIYIGSFKTIEEAVQARDNYIISNNLPHKLSTEYKKE